MAIKEPIVASIANRTWCIDEFGMDALYLLEGDEKALLIDTGTGVFDIPALAARLTDKPLTVALTHGHVDHVGGIDQFPEVYLHPDDMEMTLAVTPADRADYVKTMLTMSEGIYDMTPESVVVTGATPKLLPLTGGAVIHLGGRDVEVYETPGHTPGGLSFLDKKERLLISGDACNCNTLLTTYLSGEQPKSSVSNLLATAKLLESLAPHYDRHYNGHVGYAAAVSVLPMPERLFRDAIELCRGLLDGSIQGSASPAGSFGGEGSMVAVNNTLQVVYRPEQVK